MERFLAHERNVRACALLGAVTIAFSSILVRLSHASPSTAAIFRCAYALPILGLLAWLEDRRLGRRWWSERRFAVGAGVFFAADLILWHHSIGDIGAGLATVLANIQVVLVPLVAWMWLAEKPGRRVLAALPLALLGVLLISGVLEHGAYGQDPTRGAVYGLLAGVAYVGFLLLLRHSGADIRRPAGPLFDATATAAVLCMVAGLIIGDAQLVPELAERGVAADARADLAGRRVAADHDLAVAPARSDDRAPAHRSARRVGGARRADLQRVAELRPARRGDARAARAAGRDGAAAVVPRLRDRGRVRETLERGGHVGLGELRVLETAREERVVRGEVEVTVAR